MADRTIADNGMAQCGVFGGPATMRPEFMQLLHDPDRDASR
jgi:hypothetical protein